MRQTPLQGYDKLAALMTVDPGSSIFRRFSKLNAKNLLYLQAELAYVQADLDDIIEEDMVSGSEEKANYPFSVWSLKGSPEEQPAQWVKVLEARRLLNEYKTSDLEVLQDWLDREESTTMFLSPLDQWRGENEKDLISLCNRHDGTDFFTRWVYTRFVPWFHRRWGHQRTDRKDIESGVWYYDNHTIKSRTYIISLLISGFLPASAIIVVYFVRDTAARLVTIFVYNMIFVLVMGLMVKARRVEVFATATAFAAVQVAMITNNGGS
ncbi:hypothetical protein BO70DRAFT_431023 [Aspergillus heteromorphus CBS 117.55]|uniref:DUF6594 domain-containing protein n=1 Tax=Aspergillus heteromorphus CBS 117.55 TaxID=1448321 RepID=A0A317VP50_9EURO|nr:uncharacterized protein BO70DRAFT_431023 [Aspergillus heteromorphus CBS 117.55]PWY75031.1 hypothetical protein BO70DRAFT_431023 [Aspergillus heteromorphus CBS 117.55]